MKLTDTNSPRACPRLFTSEACKTPTIRVSQATTAVCKTNREQEPVARSARRSVCRLVVGRRKIQEYGKKSQGKRKHKKKR